MSPRPGHRRSGRPNRISCGSASAAAIRALSPKLRDALLLAQAGDYSYEEIGAMLGAPLGTIKWRVSEARRVIRKHLRERGYGDVG